MQDSWILRTSSFDPIPSRRHPALDRLGRPWLPRGSSSPRILHTSSTCNHLSALAGSCGATCTIQRLRNVHEPQALNHIAREGSPRPLTRQRSMKRRDDIRNVAIIAHVDHGKTTLVDAMLRQSGPVPRLAASGRADPRLQRPRTRARDHDPGQEHRHQLRPRPRST